MAKLYWNKSGILVQSLTSLVTETNANPFVCKGDNQLMFVMRKTELNLENCYF